MKLVKLKFIINLLIIAYFEIIESYLLSKNLNFPYNLDQFKTYTVCHFLFFTWLNWAVNMYIIWFKNT